MPTVGDKLRAERERRGLSVHQAADGTNIKTDHIRAMEQGAWASFPAPVYIRGFARTYAKFLRLDEKEVVEAVVAEMGGLAEWDGGGAGGGRSRGPIDYLMLQLSRVKWTVVFPLLLGGAVILVGWLAFRSWQAAPKHDPLERLSPGLVEPRSRPPGTLPLPTNAPSLRSPTR